MAKNYTVQDSQTGKTITFAWVGEQPPTEEDMAHVVEQATAPQSDPKDYLPVTADGNTPSIAEEMSKSSTKWTPKQLKGAIELSKAAEVPKWGEENPNLYGAYGAAKAIGRTGIEAAGQIAGGALGAASPLPGGALIGAGLGYAGAKQLADYALGDEEWHPPTFGDVMKDTAIGSVTHGIGTVLPKIPGAVRSIADFAKGSAPALTENMVKERAGGIIASKMGSNPAYEANAAEAAQIMDEIPGFRASIAEMRNDPGLIKLQRGYERGDTPAAHALLDRNAANRQALDSYLQQNFGDATIEPTLDALNQKAGTLASRTSTATQGARTAQGSLSPVNDQAAGQQLREGVERALAPVKAQETALWSKVPNYSIPSPNTDAAFQEVLSTPSTAEDVVRKIQGIYSKTPKTVQGLQTLEREVNSAIADGTQTEKHFLGQIKRAINEDFNAMGEAADAGDVAVYDGRIIHPSKLQAEQTKLTERIAQEQASAETTPDIPAIRQALQEAGEPPNLWMKQVNETDAQYNNRLITRFRAKVGVDLPMLSAQEPPTIAPIKDRIAQIDDILTNAQPAKNVADAYSAAKKFSREQKFERFDRGAIKEILKPGNSPNGKAVSDSQVVSRFFSGPRAADEADQLIKAVGDQTEAANLMEGHIAKDLVDYAQNPTTKELNPQRLSAWLKKNGEVLDKYGLRAQYEDLDAAHATLEAAKEAEKQFQHSIAAKMLNADPRQAIAAAMQGNAGMHGGGISSRNTGAIMKDLMGQLNGNRDAIEGLRAGFKDFIVDLAETTRKTIQGDSIISPAAVQKALAKYEPAMKVLYRDAPNQYRALKAVSKAVEIQSRSASSPLGGGSDTTENAFVNLMRLIEHVPVVGGPVGALSRLTKLGLGAVKNMNQKQVDEMVVKMLYDPELAEAFVMAARRQAPQEVSKRINKYLSQAAVSTATYGAMNSDPLGIRRKVEPTIDQVEQP